MKKALCFLLLLLVFTMIFSGCFPHIKQVRKEVQMPAGEFNLSSPHHTIVEEEYIFTLDEGKSEIWIPLFINNDHQYFWETSFRPSPQEKIRHNGETWGRWTVSDGTGRMRIRAKGEGYLMQKQVFYPMGPNPSDRAFYSYMSGSDKDWEELRREIALAGDYFDALKFGFVTLMTEERDLSLGESYSYLARIAREYDVEYTFPAGYIILRNRLVPRVWFAFKGPRQEWWYVDLENARRENSYYYFGNITQHHLIREYLEEYEEDYKGPRISPTPRDQSAVLKRYKDASDKL